MIGEVKAVEGVRTVESREAKGSFSEEFITFGCLDRNGRSMGSRIRRYVVTYVEASASATFYYLVPAGTYFGFRPQATRCGQKFGALQEDRLFATEAEREAAIARYLDSARNRAAGRTS